MKQRINVIDGLRGFSLLGILLANMLVFQYGMYGKDHVELASLDKIAYVWTKIFVESSFLPIFMFLFGYSLVKLKEKLERNEKKVKRHLIRRFLLLIGVGLLHFIFIWEGDILLSYGLIGFLMLIFLNRKKKTILVWAILLFTLTSAMFFGEWEATEKEIQTMESYIDKETTAYSTGSYAEIMEFRNSEEDPFGFPDYFYLILLLMAPLVMSPLFLFGMYAAKSNWFQAPEREISLYQKVGIVFSTMGILLKSSPYLFTDQAFWTEAAYMIGATFLAIGYIFGFAYFYSRLSGNFLNYLDQVGRLSMTNYLMQSIICTIIFYGYGFGFYEKLGVFLGIVLGVGIFAIQIICSHLYLKIFRVGPFEKMMRIGTYLTWNGQPKKKKEEKTKIA